MNSCLVVDPTPSSRAGVRAAAELEGFRVFKAGDAEQALSLLSSHSDVRIVIIAWRLPWDDALELCARARESFGDRALYLLAVASAKVATLAHEVLRDKVDGLLVRPFHPLELRIHLRSALRFNESVARLHLLEGQTQSALDYTVSIVDTVREPLLVVDRTLRVRSANQSFYRTFGLLASGVIDTLLPEVGTGEWNDPRLRLLLEGVFSGDAAFDDFELQIGYRTLLINARQLHGDRHRVLMAFEDVTAQRLALRSLRDSEESYRQQVEGARQHGIIQLDASGRVTRWSVGAARLLGFSEADMQHNTLPAPEGLPQPDLAQAAATGSALQEGWYVRKDGSRVFLQAVLTSVTDSHGELVGYVQVMHDETAPHVQALALAAAYEKEHNISSVLERKLLRELEQEYFPGLQVECFYRPTLDEARVGGDFYDVFKLGSALAVVVGDASGKGLAAAERTIAVRYGLRAFLMEDASPATALSRVNRLLLRTSSDAGEFVAATAALVWPEDGRVSFATAGMEGPLRTPKSTKPWTPGPVGLPLGVVEEPEYENSERFLSPGEVLMLFTDGLTDVRRHGQLLGSEGVCRIADGCLHNVSLRAGGQELLAGIERYGPLQDDACLLLVRRS